MRRIHIALLTVLLFVLPGLAMAQSASLPEGLRIVLSTAGGDVEVTPTMIDGEGWLFLPAFAAEDRVAVSLDGKPLRVQAEPDTGDGVQRWQLYQGDAMVAALHAMQGKHLRAFFLFSDDPVHRGRAYIESSENHETETTGAMAMVDAHGQVAHAGRLQQIRGRGNGTWEHDKRPYQIKLVESANLLDTGSSDESSHTWVLLAEATDSTLLHNRIAMDLALEIGMEDTSRSEFVDLYYDGEYRGVYLLAEKVEIGSGRVDEVDYDKLINTWNKRVGKKILDILPVGQSTNRYGNTYTYIEGVGDKGDPGAGAYLLELEHPKYTLSDRCWFSLSDGVVFASKSPENASESMMLYISERMESARRTLQNGGTNPETGRTTAEEFDLDSFARLALVGELAYNIDALTYSSTWFVLPAGSDRFEAGPVWDYDLAWRYLVNGRNQDAQGLKNNVDWAQDFYSDPAFVSCMRRIWTEQMAPLVSDVLLGSSEGHYLRPLHAYAAEIEASRRMNERIWETYRDKRLVYGETAQQELELLESFIRQRWEWLNKSFAGSWEPEKLDLTFSVQYSFADSMMTLSPLPWPHVMPVFYCTQLSPATETDYARYRVDVYLSLADWSAMSDPTPVVNGTELSYDILPDGRMHFALTFEDISYRPVEYNGMDIGRIYNYDYYILNHPEVLDVCGPDPEAVLAYFCEEGMKLGHKGNAHLDAQRILDSYPSLIYDFWEEWQRYYWEYLHRGYAEEWIKPLGDSYQPPVENAQ